MIADVLSVSPLSEHFCSSRVRVSDLEFSNSVAGGNFEIMRVCMGKRNLTQSCVLYEVTPNNKSHACEPLEILKLNSRRQL